MTHTGQTETPPINVLILGPPVVTCYGQPVKINRREQRAGLYYLAASIEPVSRAAVCEMFWSKDTDQNARKKLREGLSRLRSAFPVPDALIADNESISLNWDLVRSDFREYHHIVTPLLTSSEMNVNGKLSDWCYSQLREAIQLCRSPQFLQGFSMPGETEFENWQTYANLSYSISREKILHRLVDHSISVGNMNEAIHWLELTVDTDPLNNDLNFLLLNCLKENGQIKEANAYLDLLEKRYQSYLPTILSGFRDRLKSKSSPVQEVYDKSDWPKFTQKETPFIGREKLFEEITNAYHRKGIVQLNGQEGVGKTRLVREFFTSLGFRPRLLLCTCKPTTSNPPYSFLMEGLKATIEEEDWLTLPEQVRKNLQPFLRYSGSDGLAQEMSPSELLSDEMKPRSFKEFSLLLEHLARLKPLLMVVDDAQWCDNLTIEFLSYLNEIQFFKQNGLLTLITRKEERNDVLESYLDWSILISGLEEFEVEPFSAIEVKQLISTMLGKPVDDEFATGLWKRSGGNAFILTELFKALQRDDLDSSYHQTAFSQIPSPVLSFIKKKMRFLSKPAQKILLNAAILWPNLEAKTLETMFDFSYGEYIPALEELQQKCILRSVRPSSANLDFEFIHGITREIVLQNASPARQRSLHLAAVAALKKSRGNDPELAKDFAEHYELAGEKTLAFDAWCESARFERRRFDKQAAYACYQKAVTLLPDLPVEMYSGQLHGLIYDWGDYAYDLDDTSTCRMLYDMAREYGEAHQDTVLIADALCGFGRLAEMQGQFDEGIDSLNRALFFLKNSNDKQRLIETYSRLGFLFEIKHEYKRARTAFEEGLKIEKDLSDQKMLDSAVNLETRYSLLVCMMGFPSLAEEIADQAVNESLLVFRQSARVQAYAALAAAQYYGGKYKKSFQNAIAVYKLACQLNLSRWKVLLDLVLAKDYLASGLLDESWDHLQSAMEHSDIFIMKDMDLFSTTILGDIYRLLGDLPAAEAQYRKGSTQRLDTLQSLENYYLLGLTLCIRGKAEEGISIIREAALKADALGLEGVSMLAGLYAQTLSSDNLNEESMARDILPIIKKMEERGFGSGRWNAALIQGEFALRQGKIAVAKKTFLETLRITHDMDHHWVELWALTGLVGITKTDKVECYHYQQRILSLLDEMSEHALKKPLNTLFGKFRKQVVQKLHI